VLLVACGKSASVPKADGEPYAIGTTLGAQCTYDGPASVVKIDPQLKVATLVGPGLVTKTCGDRRSTHEVVKATLLRIEGPAAIHVGATDQRYVAKLFAGARELGLVDAQPAWFQGPDCDGIAAFGAIADGSRELIAKAPGQCTLHAELFGARGSVVVKIE
jgi:hypothetical protein